MIDYIYSVRDVRVADRVLDSDSWSQLPRPIEGGACKSEFHRQ